MREKGKYNVIRDCEIGEGTTIWSHVNLYECTIGEYCNISSYVEIGKGVKIGNNCKIMAYVFIPPGITIEDRCFIGPGVKFANDRYPPSGLNPAQRTLVKEGASIGIGCLIAPGITIGKEAKIRMGSKVTRDVKDGEYYRGEEK